MEYCIYKDMVITSYHKFVETGKLNFDVDIGT